MGSKFTGKHSHSIDAKGRIIVPAKFRENLGESFIVTLGLDGCLCMYSNDEWDLFLEELKKLPGTREARQLKRFFMASAEDCEVDKQGRVLIPTELREAAGLVKDVVSVGNLNKVEIWSKERWEETTNYGSMDEVAEHLSEYGISF